MHRSHRLAHLILAVVVALGLTPLMIVVDTQAQIAFSSRRDGNAEIYVMDANGDNPRRLTNNSDDDWDPSWSPDGKRIVFCSSRDGPIPEIYVMNADGKNQRNLSNNPKADRSPSWSPDGKRIVFESNRGNKDKPHNIDIYVMDTDGGNQQNLTNNNPNEDRDPSWSPDGERIVFCSSREGHVVRNLNTTYEIYVMDADGGNQQRITENRNNELSTVWSPDGERIAFAADRKGDWQNFEIYVMDADGGNQQKLTNNRAWDWSPSWSPNSERIVFHSKRDGNYEIYVIDADGGNLQNLTNNRHGDANPAWLNSPFSVAPVGKKFTMWGRLKGVDR